jgi:hypothetical protein
LVSWGQANFFTLSQRSLTVSHLSPLSQYFEPAEKIIWEFEEMHGIKIDDIDTVTWEGKRLRGDLLILLKDIAGLKYKEIKDIGIFSDLSFSSLPRLYRISRDRKKDEGF